MKKHVKLIMGIVLIFLVAFALTACDTNKSRAYYGTYISGNGDKIIIDKDFFTIEDGKSHESASVEYKEIGDKGDKLDLYRSSEYFGSCLLFEDYQVACLIYTDNLKQNIFANGKITQRNGWFNQNLYMADSNLEPQTIFNFTADGKLKITDVKNSYSSIQGNYTLKDGVFIFNGNRVLTQEKVKFIWYIDDYFNNYNSVAIKNEQYFANMGANKPADPNEPGDTNEPEKEEYVNISINNLGDKEDFSIKVEKGAKIKLPIDFKKLGYKFVGWGTWGGYDLDIDSSNSIIADRDIEIYAKWEIVTYTISYDSNGGVLGEKKESFTIHDLPYTLPIASKETLNFAGWKVNGEDTIISKIDKVEKDLKNYELTAVYENIENAFEFKYIPTLNGYELTKYTGNARVVEIPSLYKGVDVKSIGNSAFSSNESVCDIILPDTITKIGSGAFYYCTRLTSVMLPNSITDIGNYTFSYCTSLTNIAIPRGVTKIGDDDFIDLGVFYNCTSLTSITIPDSVTNIGSRTFKNCKSLTDITMPNSVTNIGTDAFYNCTSLASITIPNSVTTIGGGAFYNCTSLASITIPNSVTTIGGGAFYNCTSLTSITIPNSVTNIDNNAFKNCNNLKTIYVESEKIVNSTDMGHCLFDYADDIYMPADIEITNSFFDVVCEKKENVIVNNKEYFHFKRR